MSSIDTSRPYPLTWDDLEGYQPPRSRPPGRYFCPVHGGDHQPSVIVDRNHPQTRWKCMNCQAWGYLDPDRNWRPEPKPRTYQERAQKQARREQAPISPALLLEPPRQIAVLADLQAALPESPAARYLAARGISLETACRFGLGYSVKGSPLKPWKWGRVVIPHTDPQGNVISLYGRAIDGISERQAPKEARHDHLQGKKGIFNAPALLQPAVFICEGAFDALALLEAGYPACALYGLNGLIWEWVEAQELIFCLDNDRAGSKAFFDLAEAATDRGKQVYRYRLPDGCKDVSQAWEEGRLSILEQMEPGLHLWMLANWQEWDGEDPAYRQIYEAVGGTGLYRELVRPLVKA